MSDLFDIKFIISIFLLMVFPLSFAYHDALRMANLSNKQHFTLWLITLLTTILAINISFTLIGQIDENSFSTLNLFPVFILFLIGARIRRKFPDIFLKTLFKNSIESKK